MLGGGISGVTSGLLQQARWRRVARCTRQSPPQTGAPPHRQRPQRRHCACGALMVAWAPTLSMDAQALPYAPARAKRAIIVARRGKGYTAPFSCSCGESNLEAPCDKRRGSPQVFHSIALYGDTYDGLCAEPMAVIVLRASDATWLHTTGGRLRTLYDQVGCQVLSLPIPDCGVLPLEDLAQAVQHMIAHAQPGPHIVMHGAAGLGSPGLLRASLARRALRLSGAEAIP